MRLGETLAIAIRLATPKYTGSYIVGRSGSGRNHVEALMGFGTGASPDHRAVEAQIDDEMLALVTQLTNEINWYMRERGLTRADLAARMGVSPGRVSQILGGTENLTLRTLAALSTALDARFDIELSALKAGDTYTSRGTAQAEAAPAGHRYTLSRAAHRGARLGR
jgi:transcriptional regulator with XRE-family HTH domain